MSLVQVLAEGLERCHVIVQLHLLQVLRRLPRIRLGQVSPPANPIQAPSFAHDVIDDAARPIHVRLALLGKHVMRGRRLGRQLRLHFAPWRFEAWFGFGSATLDLGHCKWNEVTKSCYPSLHPVETGGESNRVCLAIKPLQPSMTSIFRRRFPPSLVHFAGHREELMRDRVGCAMAAGTLSNKAYCCQFRPMPPSVCLVSRHARYAYNGKHVCQVSFILAIMARTWVRHCVRDSTGPFTRGSSDACHASFCQVFALKTRAHDNHIRAQVPDKFGQTRGGMNHGRRQGCHGQTDAYWHLHNGSRKFSP